MTWFLVALAAPLLYTAANYIDKYVLNRFVKEEGGVGGIVIFSSIFAAIMIPISFLIVGRENLNFDWLAAALALNGAISITSLILYLNALQKYDTSSVVPLYQLIPVFSYGLGYLILGETLSSYQIIAGLLVIIGAFVLSLQIEGGRFHLNRHLLGLMAVASVLFALTGTIFKKLALEVGYWPSQFWEYCGIALTGFAIFLFVKKYRRDFAQLYRQSRGKVFGYNVLAELCMIGGDLLFGFSLLLAPVTLVYVVNSLQPLFILVIGLILSWLLPRYYAEVHSRKNLAQKTLAIVIMVAGAVLLTIYG